MLSYQVVQTSSPVCLGLGCFKFMLCLVFLLPFYCIVIFIHINVSFISAFMNMCIHLCSCASVIWYIIVNRCCGFSNMNDFLEHHMEVYLLVLIVTLLVTKVKSFKIMSKFAKLVYHWAIAQRQTTCNYTKNTCLKPNANLI